MPLFPGSSRSAISKNVRRLVREGRSQKQAVAIALKKSRTPLEGNVDDKPWWLLAVPLGAAIIYVFWPKGVLEASVSADAPLSASQKEIIALIRAEARRQGVPEELALAFADLESKFQNVKAAGGESYGPMQVHISHLKPGEDKSILWDMSVSIPRGVAILKNYLKKAGGVSAIARTIYFCGPGSMKGPLYGCKTMGAVQTNQNRWQDAAAKWGVKDRYPV